MLYHHQYFKDVAFKFEPHVCNKCSIKCVFSKSKRIKVLNLKAVNYRCVSCCITRNKDVNILNNSVLEDKSVIVLNNSVVEDRDWINEIKPYDWVCWYFRYWLGRRSQDDEGQINRWNCKSLETK